MMREWNKKASVSAIIPCFNCAMTIDRAVGSVMGQTVLPFEIILVNDGSSDATPEKLFNLKKRFPAEIKLIHLSQNYGPSRARNAAWESAAGDYLAFLDADDSWHSRKIEIQYNWMTCHPEVAMSGHQCMRMMNDESPENDLPKNWRAHKVGRFHQLLSNRLLTRSVMLKRALPFRFNENKRHSEDYLLWLEILLNKFQAGYLDLPLAYSYKAPYGDKGLSANLWNMEKGELDTYRKLYHKELISFLAYYPLVYFSMLKHVIRFVKFHLFIK
jgi:glycosyltransferase involved in cell wall biosynthesis